MVDADPTRRLVRERDTWRRQTLELDARLDVLERENDELKRHKARLAFEVANLEPLQGQVAFWKAAARDLQGQVDRLKQALREQATMLICQRKVTAQVRSERDRLRDVQRPVAVVTDPA